MDEDYYQVLKVSRNATAAEIDKAYRRLARKYHPDLQESDRDKEQAKQQFQRIQAAYDVLSDPEKRKKYDQFGPGFEQMAGGSGPFPGGQFRDVEIDWSQLFGGGQGGPFQGFFEQLQGARRGGGARAARTAAEPAIDLSLHEEITIPFAMAILGGEYRLQMSRDGQHESIVVKIPAGIEDGKRVRLKGQGRRAPTGQRGDLLVRVRVAPHPYFKRQGSNLHVRVPVTIFEAWLGAKIDVPTPHGTVAVTIPPGSSSGRVLRVKGFGVRSESKSWGDLYVELEIVVPASTDPSIRQKIEELHLKLPMPDPRRGVAW